MSADSARGGVATLALPREMILASAGSGKTFRISSRILELLARGEPPEAIFASTFTRKAAGEILGRVLTRLAEAALDPASAAGLAEHAAAPLDSERCLALLAGLARRLHRLNISTLDAFFVRAAQCFAHELGLPPAWEIADEPTARRIRSEALQEALRRGDPGTLVEVVREASRGQATRSVHDALLRRLDDLHAILHQLDPSVSDPWRLGPPPGAPGAADDGAGEPAALALLADAIAAIDPPRNRSGEPKKHWVNALARAAETVRRGAWEEFLSITLTQKVVTGEAEYDRVEIPDEVRSLFRKAIDEARRALRPRLAAQLAALGRLVALFDEALARRQREEGAYRFEDVTRLLGGPASPAARPDVHYRLDGRIRHILLDEFQDTSIPQWSALRPLMDGLLADGEPGAAVVVADPKQSIYGWRGANPALVRAVGDRYALPRDILARSWRSSQVVLDAVNAVFEGIADNPVLRDTDHDVAADWARAFARHEAARDLPGHVRIQVGPPDDGGGDHRPRLLARAAALARELHTQAPGFGIGILTRQNRAVAHLIHELRRLGIDASEEGGNPLTDSAAVASVFALLHLADHPDDTVARYHVARTPVGAAVGFHDWRDDAAARRLAHRTRERLIRDGYGATLDELARRLLPACDARDARRLLQLVDLAFRYEPRASLRPTDFVRLVETERVEDPLSAPVRVMTVHQSKGLEFDIVILPELDAKIFRGGGAGALPYRADPAGPITRVYPYAAEPLRPLFPEIEEAYRQHRATVLRDALSALYVAMTRARHALHVLVKPDGGTGRGTALTAARILCEALAPDQRATEGAVLYEAGDPAWFARTTPSRPTVPRAALPAPVPRLREARARRRLLPHRSPSGLEGGDAVDLELRLRLDTAPSLARGSLVHAWCEEIAWIEDGLPDDTRLSAIARRLAPGLDDAELATLAERFRAWVAHPAIHTALRRDAYPAGARLERELPFVHRSGDAIVQGSFDRLVVWEEDGRPAGAEVLDFKTDDIAPDDAQELERRLAFYRPQLEAYRTAAAGLYRLEPARVRARFLFLQAGAVREV